MKSIRLRTGKHFVYSNRHSFADLQTYFPKGFVLNGCSQRSADAVLANHGSVYHLGNSAWLNLADYTPSKSLHQLQKRGAKKARHQEIDHISATHLMQIMSHNEAPRLRYLFETTPLARHRCFIARCKETSRPLCLITVSLDNLASCELQLMVRNNSAPVGVMESLILATAVTLRDEGFASFNLGEVPFVNLSNALSLNVLCARVGATLLGHAYNYEGLYRFKNKFNPFWVPTYWCGWPALTIVDLVEVARVTNTLALLFYGLHSFVKDYFFADYIGNSKKSLEKDRIKSCL